MKTSRSLVVLLVLGICFGGCSRQPAPPTEREAKANLLINQTFKGSKEFWFAASKLLGGKKLQLVQLHNPSTSLYSVPVSETDRMNGVSERFKLVVECEQSRTWDGKWTPWREETGSKAAITNTMFPSAAVGFWVIQFEAVNGEWHTKNTFPVRDLAQDKVALDALMRDANVTP
jgi:hypothetical protein